MQPTHRQLTLAPQDCFDKFSVREQLGENDKWYCATCKDHVRAYKHMEVSATRASGGHAPTKQMYSGPATHN